MELRLCHDVDIRTDKTSTLALPNPRGGSCNDGFCARDVHSLEEEPCTKIQTSEASPNEKEQIITSS